MKRVCLMWLVICLMTGMLSIGVSAEGTDSGTCGDNVTWVLEGDTLIISGTGPMNDYDGFHSAPWKDHARVVDHVIVKDGVTRVGENAFSNSGVRTVKLANSVTSIGQGAFFCCEVLTSVEFGTGVTTIESMAFSSSFSLKTVVLPKSLRTLGGESFSDSSLTGIAIPEGVTVINNGAFRASGLTKVMIPVSVTQINYAAFRSCDNLTDVYYAGTQEQWEAINIDATVDGKGGSNDALFSATIHYSHSHSWGSSSVKQKATCQQSGTKTSLCTVCPAGKVEKLSKTGHSWDSGSVSAAATCAKEGTNVYTCTVCGTTKKEPIAKTDQHIFDVGKVTQEPTCAAEGIKTYTCTVCETTKTEEVAKTDQHIWDEGTPNEDNTATYICNVCGTTKTEEIPVTDEPDDKKDAANNQAPEASSGEADPKKGPGMDPVIYWVIGIAAVATAGAAVWLVIKKKKQ